VELPREKPEAPLRLFAGVPGLRVVAIGGDGTVAWLLGCLEDLGRERAAAGLPWRAPPVGMLPLGTGAPLWATPVVQSRRMGLGRGGGGGAALAGAGDGHAARWAPVCFGGDSRES